MRQPERYPAHAAAKPRDAFQPELPRARMLAHADDDCGPRALELSLEHAAVESDPEHPAACAQAVRQGADCSFGDVVGVTHIRPEAVDKDAGHLSPA